MSLINEETEAARQELRAAWDDLIENMQRARDIIDSPEQFAPPASPRGLAEGYRYLTGFVHHAIERSFHENPDYPGFRNALSVFNKSTIDNSDAIYFYSPIDGSKRYRITGQVADHAHWRGENRSGDGPFAPQYLIFETSTGPIAGDSGELMELMPGFRTGFGSIDSSALQVDANGHFEILTGPECPEGYTGNFICTRKPAAANSEDNSDRYAEYVSGRQLFYDWQREEAVPLQIVALDHMGDHPAPLDPGESARQLRRMGSIAHGQMKFWLHFYDVVLNVRGVHEEGPTSRYFMPVNGYNRPNAASSDTGGGMGTNIYAGGIFDLADDEALYIEATFTGDPVYVSFHLGNLWGESPDYANHQSSLNLHQMHMGADGVQRWVVAHSDPGVQNWLDTTGLKRGFLSHRWAYSELPPESEWPQITCRKVALKDAAACFPADMPVLSESQRRDEIAVRQAHVQRRFRVF